MIRRNKWKFFDKIKRKFFLKYILKQNLSKTIIKNKQIPLLCKYNTQRNLIQLPHYKNITLQRNRCLLTGRSYGVIRSFKLARFSLRFKVYNGYILNLKRYSN